MKNNKYIIFYLFLIISILFVALPVSSYAQAPSPVTSPSFNCLGPCASGSPSGPPPSGISSFPQPSNPAAPSSQVASIAPVASTQPCHTSLSTQHRGYRERGGFLDILFKFFILLINLILNGVGTNGISLPCTPSTVTSPQPTNPSTAPQPPVAATSPLPSQPATSSNSSSSLSSSISSTGTSTPSNAPNSFSDNWGGYAVTSTFPANSVIKSDWIVTPLDCSGGDGNISPWPGFGGWDQSDPNIAQLGNDMSCTGGQAAYPAWTEAFPADSVYSQNTMKANDHMTATVTFQGSGKFATTMTNVTQGWTITTPMDFKDASYSPKTAEVIFEALGGNQSNSGGTSQKIPVPKFAPLTFTNAVFSNGSQQSPLGSGTKIQKITLGVNNDAQVTTGPISGSTFTQTFVHN